MSRENVEQVHRITAALNRHDIDAVLAFVDPDVEFIPRLMEVDGGGSYRGDGPVERSGHCSEAATEQTSWVVTKWRGGKAIWIRNFQRETEALEAAGLSE